MGFYISKKAIYSQEENCYSQLDMFDSRKNLNLSAIRDTVQPVIYQSPVFGHSKLPKGKLF